MTLDWDNLRYFLAVMEHGSTKRAAVALRVDQTTCARRIGALEASIGLELFTRESGRYLPTKDALELVQSARRFRLLRLPSLNRPKAGNGHVREGFGSPPTKC